MKEVAAIELGNFPVNYFYRAVYIYLKKSQVVNRKLSCSSNVVFLKLNLKSGENKLKADLIKNLEESSCNNPEKVFAIVSSLAVEFNESQLDDLKHFDESNDGIFLSIDRMVPRNTQKFQTCTIATFIGKLDV